MFEIFSTWKTDRKEMIYMKKIAAVITDLFEDIEYTSPKEAYENAGHEVVTIGFEKGSEVTGKQGTVITTDVGIDDVTPDQFDALFIPGGFSPDQLRADERFVQFAKTFMDEKKPVFTICHGPQLLITAETLEGRDITGYTSILVDLKNAGATVHDEEVFVCQNQLVSSRNPDDLPAFERESLKLLGK